MMDIADQQRQWMSKDCEESSDHQSTTNSAMLGPTPEENLRLLQEIEANRAFILLAYQSDPKLLRRADPEIRRLFENDDRATWPQGQEHVTQGA